MPQMLYYSFKLFELSETSEVVYSFQLSILKIKSHSSKHFQTISKHSPFNNNNKILLAIVLDAQIIQSFFFFLQYLDFV